MSKLMIKLSLTLKLNVQSACQLVSPHSGVQMLDGVSANLRLDTTVHWFLHHPLHHTSLSLDYRDLSSYFQRHLHFMSGLAICPEVRKEPRVIISIYKMNGLLLCYMWAFWIMEKLWIAHVPQITKPLSLNHPDFMKLTKLHGP